MVINANARAVSRAMTAFAQCHTWHNEGAGNGTTNTGDGSEWLEGKTELVLLPTTETRIPGRHTQNDFITTEHTTRRNHERKNRT